MITIKFEEYINEGNIITNVKNSIKNFKRYGSIVKQTQKDVIGLLKALVNMNDEFVIIDGGVKINRNDSIYYLYINGKVIFPSGSELYIDKNIALEIFYEFIKKKDDKLVDEAFGSKISHYNRMVRMYLLEIICDKFNIENKRKKKELKEAINVVFFYNPEVDDTVRRYEQSKKNPEKCAQHIYKWFIDRTDVVKNVLNEGNLIKSIKDYFSKEEEEIEPEEDNTKYRKKESEINFPCVYYFLTDELVERLSKKDEPIGIVNNGYGFYCETPEQLEKYKEEFKVGNTYNGETITKVYIGPERNF